MKELLQITLSLLPVLVFLAALMFLDSYKLVKRKSVIVALAVGCGSAIASLYVNRVLIEISGMEVSLFTRYGAPVVEEILKSAWLVVLMFRRKIGFTIDAAIFGAALGAGFALVENIYYLQSVANADILIWVVRGFGTAIMHAGVTATFAVIAKGMSDAHPPLRIRWLLPGLIFSIVIHSIYNQFILPPMVATFVILVVQPLMFLIIFQYSEKSLGAWLGKGMDAELELFDLITSGEIGETKLGKYLESLKDKFPGPVVVDMLCYLRIHLELALAAKGFLMMRHSGHKTEIDPEIRAQFEEMKFLEKSIGPTGKLAIAPIIQTSDRDLWQMYMLQE